MQDTEEMILAPECTFLMGGSEDGRNNNERPRRHVSLDSFAIDAYEVTNREFEQFVEATGYITDAEKRGQGWIWDEGWREQQGANWRHPNGPSSSIERIMDHPVVQVSWNDADAYCRWRRKRLPTEAEWECSCRAGTKTRYSVGNTIAHDDANYSGTGKVDRWEGTSPVGSFPPNPWGLYDMHGNVWEWCADWYDGYQADDQTDPTGPPKGKQHVLRGGSWSSFGDDCRSSSRSSGRADDRAGYYGFRVAATF